MGIYREIRYLDEQGHPTSLEYAMSRTVTVHVSEPGLEYVALIKPEDWKEHRTDCYCCSCPEHGQDPACRNHGWAAKRPCDLHNMLGSEWDDEMVPGGGMPDSVQVARAKDAQR